MGMIFKIAWRNILRHKGKSIVIGIILFLGAFLMTLGNGVISGMEEGLKKNIVNTFTGNIVIISDKQKDSSVLFTVMGKAIEPVNNYPKIKSILEKQEYIEKFIPAGKNMAMAINEEGGEPGYVYLLGVDFEQYKDMFPNNMKIIEGRDMLPGEKGVLVGTGGRKDFYDFSGIWALPEGEKVVEENLTKEAKADKENLIFKDNFVFMGFNEDNTTNDIRTGVKGIVKYNALNSYWGSFILIDIDSYRDCLGYFSATEKVEISDEKKKLLETFNPDDMFSDETMTFDTAATETSDVEKIDFKSVAVTPAAIKEKVNVEAGTFNLVFVKLKEGTDENKAKEMLNEAFNKAGMGGEVDYGIDGKKVTNKWEKQKKGWLKKTEEQGARAVTWKEAVGIIGNMATLIKGALFVFVMFVFFVAIIIIVNTLSMAAIERTSEIGMMRAVGAKKGFISLMFSSETAFLSFFFGGAGIVAGVIVVVIMRMVGLTTDHEMLQLLYGGDKFMPVITLGDFILCIIQLIIVTLLAMIYPIKVARSITPLDAISRD